MNKQELYNSLNFLFDGQNEIGFNMYMILNTDDGYVTRKADLDQPVIDELRIKFLSRLKLQCSIESEIVLSEITQANDRKNTI